MAKGKCDKCGTDNEYSNVVCDFCGSRLPWAEAVTQPLAKQAPTTPIAVKPADFTCIVCDHEGVQKVSSLFKSGTWASTSTSVGVGAVGIPGEGVGMGQMASVSSSAGSSGIAKLLSPPIMPKKTSWPAVGFGCAGCTTWFVLVIIIVSVSSMITGFGHLLLLAVSGAAGYATYKQMKDKEESEYLASMPIWQRKIANWNRMFYCGRCDHVYNPESKQSVHSNEMDKLL